MLFNYVREDSIEITDSMFDEMINELLSGKSYEKAFNDVVASLDDCDYCNVDYIEEDVLKELKKRYEEIEKEKIIIFDHDDRADIVSFFTFMEEVSQNFNITDKELIEKLYSIWKVDPSLTSVCNCGIVKIQL